MTEFHTTHYNVIDTLIHSDIGLWKFVCGVCKKKQDEHFIQHGAGFEWSEPRVSMLTAWAMLESKEMNLIHTDIPQCIMNVYAEAALWAWDKDYRFYGE